MPECCVTDCKSNRKKTAKNPEPDKVQSFPFPTETTARNRWLRQCGFGKNLSKGANICAKHFRESCFLSQSENVDDRDRSRAKLRLKEDAVPTVFSFGPTPSPSKRRAFKGLPLKHPSTEVTPVPRKVQKMDHDYCSLSTPTVPNVKERYAIQGHKGQLISKRLFVSSILPKRRFKTN